MNQAEQVGGTPNAAPASASSAMRANGNSTKMDLSNVPLLPRHLREADPTPKVELLNPTLDEADLKLSLNVTINGRTIRIMDCNFSTTACGGLDPKNRGIVFQSIERLADEALQAAAIKLNAAAPVPEPSDEEIENGDGHDMTDGGQMNGHCNRLTNGASGR
jgi:uncharacterized protein YjbI with pentapeptide repeats